MNVVYLYIHSEWGQELRYSLRSIEKHLPDAKPLLIGDKPLYYKGNHIEVEQNDNIYQDVHNKLKVAFDNLDEFLFMYDDIFLLKPYKIAYYSDMKFTDRIKRTGGGRKEVMQRTLDVVGEDALNYELHYPMYFKKFDLPDDPICPKTIMGNIVDNPTQAKDCKYNAQLVNEKFLQGMPCFSTYSEDERFKTILEKLYPKPSQYEI